MLSRRLRHPGHLAREVRARSGAWLKSLVPRKGPVGSGNESSNESGDESNDASGCGFGNAAEHADTAEQEVAHEQRHRPFSDSEIEGFQAIAQLAERLAGVEAQLRDMKSAAELRNSEPLPPNPMEAKLREPEPSCPEPSYAEPDAVWNGTLSDEGLRAPSSERLRLPPLPDDLSDYSGTPSSHVTAAPNARGAAGPVVHGSVSGVGLGTLFNLLENERLAGLLSLRSDRQRLDFLFREGGIVRCECDSSRIAASEGVRLACTWNSAEFNFRRELPDEEVDAPRSANVLLLDALRMRDERAALR